MARLSRGPRARLATLTLTRIPVSGVRNLPKNKAYLGGGESWAEGLVLAKESWLAENLVAALTGISAIVLFFIGIGGGPQFGCPMFTTATGLCAMPWSYQTANADRRTLYALIAFIVVGSASFLITVPGRTTAGTAPDRRTARRVSVVIVVLALLGVALLFAAIAVGFTVPPSRTLTFTNSQLPSMGDFLSAYYGTERAAAVYLTAGEAVTATYTVAWYANGSSSPVGYGGTGYGFPPNIEPADQPYNYSAPWTLWYIVPKTGAYVIWVYAEVPIGYGPLTSNVSLTVTAYNVDFPPIAQLALASVGSVLLAGTVAVDWIAHPGWREGLKRG